MEKFHPQDFVYYQINIGDKENQDLDLYFDECNSFIKSATNVLVHCVVGKSRSPSIVLGYLIAEKKMSFDEAFKLVKLKRPLINLNNNFIRNLLILEEKTKKI